MKVVLDIFQFSSFSFILLIHINLIIELKENCVFDVFLLHPYKKEFFVFYLKKNI